MNPVLSAHQTRLLRLKSQRLLPHGPGRLTPLTSVIKDVVGLQAQDLPAALLSVRVRSNGLTASMVEKARQEQRAIMWTWCMRGTLHLITAEDAAWLLPLLAPALIISHRRRFEQLGWDPKSAAAGMRLLQKALGKNDGLTRQEIAHLLKTNGLPFEGQATVHLIYHAALEGLLCTGPDRDKKPTYVLTETWLAELKPLPRQEAVVKLALRYLAGYGPAGPADFSSWSGLKPNEAREAWQLADKQVVQVKADGQPSWLLKSQLPWLEEPFDSGPIVRLLPRFDAYLLGYANRDLVVNPANARRIHPGGGMISAVLLVDGQAQGTWKTRRSRGRLEVIIEPFESLDKGLVRLIDSEVADLGRFLDVEAVLSM